MEPDEAAYEAADLQVRVECDDVTLKLTLTSKLQKKPFKEAVLIPFLKAYSSRKGLLDAPKTLDDIQSVHVDQEYLTDLSLAANVVMLGRGVRDVEVFLKDPEAEARKARQKAAEKAEEERLAKEAEDLKDVLEVGARVEMHDLASDRVKELNGRTARLVEWVEEKKRWLVKLNDADDDDFLVSIKPANLRRPAGAKVEIHGLESEAGQKLNGLRGTVVGFSVNRGRYDVEVPGRTSYLAVRPRYLRRFCPPQEVPDLTRVMIDGVSAEAHKHMNGKEGSIVSFDGDRDRYEVAVELYAKNFNLRQANLRVLNAAQLVESVKRRAKYRVPLVKEVEKEMERSFRADMALDHKGKVARGVHSLTTELARMRHDLASAARRLDGHTGDASTLGASAEDRALSDEKRAEVRAQHAKVSEKVALDLEAPARKLECSLKTPDAPPKDGPGSRSIDDIWNEVVRTTNKQEAERRAKEEVDEDEEDMKAAVAEKERILREEREERERRRRAEELGLEAVEIN